MAIASIALFAIASMLMVFQPVRQLGTAMLASAGVAGIVVGFAAQKSLATLLAGFQLAMTQPNRIDDVVIVEGERGRIEEVTLTYVVVNIWDLRCEVREKLVAYIQENYPRSPPRVRAVVERGPREESS